VRVGEVVHQQAELARVLEEIRRIDADIDRLRTRLGELEHTYSQPRL
jgi:ubiquinone biosynthesis protein UbiJ